MAEGWEEANSLGDGSVQVGCRKVVMKLKSWGKNVLGDLDKRIRQIKDELETCRRNQLTQQSISRESLLKEKLERLEDQREMHWK